MKKNVGSVDRVLRVLVALVIGILYLSNQISGTAAIILGVLAVIFLLTGLVSVCPIYMLLGLSTKKDNQATA